VKSKNKRECFSSLCIN